MIPPFHSAVDRAISYLDPKVGLLGVADFFVPSKYDLPLRQMTWLRRFFWRYITFPPIHGILQQRIIACLSIGITGQLNNFLRA